MELNIYILTTPLGGNDKDEKQKLFGIWKIRSSWTLFSRWRIRSDDCRWHWYLQKYSLCLDQVRTDWAGYGRVYSQKFSDAGSKGQTSGRNRGNFTNRKLYRQRTSQWKTPSVRRTPWPIQCAYTLWRAESSPRNILQLYLPEQTGQYLVCKEKRGTSNQNSTNLWWK